MPQLNDKPYAVRFIKQVIQSTWHVGVTQQVIAGSVIGIITVLVQIHNGLITSELSWAYLRAALQIILLTYAGIIVLNILRAPFILDGKQRKRIAELQASLLDSEQKQRSLMAPKEDKQVTVTDAERRVFARLGGKEPPRLEEGGSPKSEPIVVCKKILQTPVRWNGRTFMPETEPKEGSLYAAVAVLVNRPKAKGRVPAIRFLSPQLTFYDIEGEYYGRVGHAFWLGHDYAHIDLSAGGEALMVLAVGNKDGMFAANNFQGRHTRYDEEKPVEFEGERFRVQAYLSEDNSGLETLSFELSRDEKGLPSLKLAEQGAA